MIFASATPTKTSVPNPQRTLDIFLREHPAGFVHPIERIVEDEPQLGREFQREALGHDLAQFVAVADQCFHRFLCVVAAEGHHIGRRDPEVG